MPEPVTQPTGTPNTPPSSPPPVSTPGDNPPANPPAFDPSSLSDEQFNKVLEDPRLFKTQRIAELREKAKKADEFEKNQKIKEQEDLKAKGEFQKLAEQKDQELQELRQKYDTSTINTALMAAAAAAGVTDLEAATLLVKRDGIKINSETGQAEGVEEAIKSLVEARPYLVGKNKPGSVGSPTNPGNPSADYDFTMTQVMDPVFYQKNYEAIQVAQRNNRIKDDRQ